MPPPEDALWVAVPAAAIAAYGGAVMMRRAAARRAWEGPATPVGELAAGRVVRVEGRLAAHGQLLRAPITGVECVGYDAWIEYLDGDSPTRVPRWFPAASETVVAPFRVEGDDGHAVVIDADRHDVELAIPPLPRRTDADFEALAPVLRRAGDPRLLRDRTLGYVEIALRPGTRITVVGRVLRPPTGGAGAYRRGAREAELGPTHTGAPVGLRVLEPDDPATLAG